MASDGSGWLLIASGRFWSLLVASRYGSERILDEWMPWLLAATEAPAPPPADAESAAAVVRRCATRRGVPAAAVLGALEKLEAASQRAAEAGQPQQWDTAVLFGSAEAPTCWELVFSSSVADLPLLGGLLGGYFPIRETLRWDLGRAALDLEIELLPFAPCLKVEGTDLTWDEAKGQLSYRVNEKPPSTWTLVFVDEAAGVIAARSSVTGLNIIQRSENR